VACIRRQSRLHSQAAQNREALQQRGEKLSRLNERTEQMEADAMDFASMARQIASRERDRKWWQM
jgi:syntaxin-binding protein 5